MQFDNQTITNIGQYGYRGKTMIKLDVKKYPIYGATIDSGQIEVFQETQEALDFFTQGSELESCQSKIQLRPTRAEREKPIPTFLINERNTEESNAQPIMSIEI